MLFKDILRRENNNFEILRLIAASAVIVGHARYITSDNPAQDIVKLILHFDYSGSLALKFFFLLSGLVVTNSLLVNPELRRFMAARIARIFPALIVVLVLSAYVIGPLLTAEPLRAYLVDHATLYYVYSNARLSSVFVLPGVFANAPVPLQSINGSIWSIPLEFCCYVLLAILGAVGLSKNRAIFSLVVLFLGATALIAPSVLDPSGRILLQAGEMGELRRQLMLLFATGALLAAWKDKVSIRLEIVVGLLMAAYVFRDTPALPYLGCLTIFAAAIWATTTRPLLKWRLPGDFSYGTYLAGWPIQQLVHTAFPDMGATGNWIIALPLAIGFGALSWYLIEKPAIQLGKRIGQGRLKTAPTDE